MSKRGHAPKSRPPTKAVAAAKQRQRRDQWRMPLIIGSLVVAVVAVAVVALTVSDQSKPENNAVPNAVEVAETLSVKGAPLPVLPPKGTDPAVGQAIPVLEGVDIRGNAVSVPQAGPAVVAVLAHWCPHCRREVPAIMQLRKSGQWPSNVALAGVSTAVAPERDNYPASSWLQREGWDAPVLVDTETQEAGEAYGLTGFPFLVWVDANGKVVLRTSGEIPKAQLAGMLEQLSRGETPTTPSA